MSQQLLRFLARIEILVQRMSYGTLSCNVILSGGFPNPKTFYIVRSKRKRFNPRGKFDKSSGDVI